MIGMILLERDIKYGLSPLYQTNDLKTSDLAVGQRCLRLIEYFVSYIHVD